MVWPIYFAKKVLKFHSRAPFDAALQSKLIKVVQDHTLDSEQYSSLQPILMIRQVLQNIASGLDGQGYARNFVPPEQFKFQIDRHGFIASEKSWFPVTIRISAVEVKEFDFKTTDSRTSSFRLITDSTEVGLVLKFHKAIEHLEASKLALSLQNWESNCRNSG